MQGVCQQGTGPLPRGGRDNDGGGAAEGSVEPEGEAAAALRAGSRQARKARAHFQETGAIASDEVGRLAL